LPALCLPALGCSLHLFTLPVYRADPRG